MSRHLIFDLASAASLLMLGVVTVLGFWQATKRRFPLAGWEIILRISNLPLVKSMYAWIIVVPILAKLLEWIKSTLSHFKFYSGLRLDFNLPLTWQLLFLSALFCTAANAIAFFLCPSFVRRFPTFAAFGSEGRDDRFLSEHIDGLVNSSMDQETVRDLKRALYPADEDNNVDVDLSRGFWRIYNHENDKYPAARLACLALYAYAAYGFLIAAVQSIWFAVKTLDFPVYP